MVDDLATARRITYNVPDLACNTTIQELKIKSYILMAHAIIEEYLENISLHVAKEAIRELNSNSTVTTALLGLISSGIIGRIEEDGISRKIKREPFEDLKLFAETAFGRFKTVVSSNNGIKKEDQLKLLIPIGIDPETEDPATMAALDSFGGKRGAIAHVFKISKSHTLSEIDGDLKTIRLGLLNYDSACLANV
ncbi:hypothetical protein E5222_08915 [Alteraurantiacibacter aquimixticola]|uniref:RiboL-PSP-HEPN domain-containing protein n=2 Tax=Alteraurantiacibacter aquimixticola TaxID=2489173 RepID=A0A4T3F6A4_9SPHN|nr:hypothetical protein E5222_08915 [Alteraurantiacibacter aquimixticola]